MSRNRGPDPEPGFVVLDKPAGMTSHDVVAVVRRGLGTRKVGHAGTLDPMATGVLLVAVGKATKLLQYLPLEPKCYRATVRLGQETSTEDAEGELTGCAPFEAVGSLDSARIAAALEPLRGQIQQVPSAVSAIKVAGRRSYELVRSGQAPQLEARPVTVHRLQMLTVMATETDRGPVWDVELEVECSAGTYVRALARDLGAELGVGGHLTALRRTAVGQFGLVRCTALSAFREDPRLDVGLDAAVAACLPRRELEPDEVAAIRHGQSIPAVGTSGPHAGVEATGRTVAVLQEQQARARPVLVLAPA